MATMTYVVTFMLVLVQATFANFDGYDLVYKPKSVYSPRALLTDSERRPLRRIFGTEFSVCLFVNLERRPNLKTVNLFSYSSKDLNEVNELVMEFDYGRSQTNLRIHGQNLSFNSTPPVGQWTHLCVTWDRSTGQSIFYGDGQEVGSGKIKRGHTFGVNGLFVLGQHQQDLYNDAYKREEGFRGKITQFNLWDFKLTEDEVKQVQRCNLEGDVVSWRNSSWILYDDIQTEPSESPCSAAVIPQQCGCNSSIMETIKDAIIEIKKDLQIQSKNSNERLLNLDESNTVTERNITVLQEEFAFAKNDILVLKRGVATCEKEIGDLKNQSYTNSSRDQQIEQLMERTAKLQSEIGFLNQSFEAYESEVAELVIKNWYQDDEITKLKERNCTCKDDADITQTKLAEYEREINILKQKNAAFEREVNGLKQQTAQTESRVNTLQQNLQQQINAVKDSTENEIRKLRAPITNPGNGGSVLPPCGPDIVSSRCKY